MLGYNVVESRTEHVQIAARWCCLRSLGLWLPRRPELYNSDHGSQYTSKAYLQCLQTHALQISMGRVRTCADNVSVERGFAQREREFVHRCRCEAWREATGRLISTSCKSTIRGDKNIVRREQKNEQY